ncbi:MAG: hypothetical protein Fur005_47360 [Roseiflexaceae bacterium]
MTPEDLEHVRKLIETNKRRLRVLDLQAAQFGLYAPAHLTLEIDDLKKEIERLTKQLGGANPTPKPDTTSTTSQPNSANFRRAK